VIIHHEELPEAVADPGRVKTAPFWGVYLSYQQIRGAPGVTRWTKDGRGLL